MGLLDDAIREHLELKRLRGADPDEVARLEREALGPPHRRAEVHSEEPVLRRAEDLYSAPQAARSGDRPAPVPAHGIYDDGAYDDRDEPAPRTLSATAQDTQEHDMATELGGQHIYDESHDRPRDDAWREDDDGRSPRGGYDGDDDHPHATGHDVDRDPHRGREDDEGDGDVLEGTPAFLQEAPEHDRLWFEQEPPRDFDFDK